MGRRVIDFSQNQGQTPIDEDELSDLKLPHVTTLEELNIWELQNIQKAENWAKKQKNDILTELFVRELHRRMFCDVWKWAGKYRKSNKNIGVDKFVIPTEIKKLLEDVKTWIEFGVYKDDELALRFHHKLVSIHPFPNGNGRHSRLMTDLLVSKKLKIASLTWGNNPFLTSNNLIRKQYISALRLADNGDIQDLIAFAKS